MFKVKKVTKKSWAIIVFIFLVVLLTPRCSVFPGGKKSFRYSVGPRVLLTEEIAVQYSKATMRQYTTKGMPFVPVPYDIASQKLFALNKSRDGGYVLFGIKNSGVPKYAVRLSIHNTPSREIVSEVYRVK